MSDGHSDYRPAAIKRREREREREGGRSCLRLLTVVPNFQEITSSERNII